MTPRSRTLLPLATAALVLLLAPAAALAQCPKTSIADIEDEVMCPVCGTPLALAQEAPQAKRQREFILDLVERCRSKSEVKAALVAEFGEDVLAVPEEEGFDLAAYLVPGLAILLGAGAVALGAARWRRARGGRGATAPATPTPEESARLDADLERFDR